MHSDGGIGVDKKIKNVNAANITHKQSNDDKKSDCIESASESNWIAKERHIKRYIPSKVAKKEINTQERERPLSDMPEKNSDANSDVKAEEDNQYNYFYTEHEKIALQIDSQSNYAHHYYKDRKIEDKRKAKLDNRGKTGIPDRAASIKNVIVTSAEVLSSNESDDGSNETELVLKAAFATYKKVLFPVKSKKRKNNKDGHSEEVEIIADDKQSIPKVKSAATQQSVSIYGISHTHSNATVEEIARKNKITTTTNAVMDNKVAQTEKTNISGVKKTEDRTRRTVYSTDCNNKNSVSPINDKNKHQKKNKKGKSTEKSQSEQAKEKGSRKLAGNILVKKFSSFLSSPQSKDENNMSAGVAKTVYEISRELGKTYLKKLVATIFTLIVEMIASLIEMIFMAIVATILPILPIILVLLIIFNMYSFLFGGVDTTQQKQSSQYYATVLSKKYSDFDRELRRWTGQGNEVIYNSGDENTDNFSDAVALYISFNIESDFHYSEISEDNIKPDSADYEYEYLIVDTEDENTSIGRAFNLLNYAEDNEEEDVKYVYKKTLEDVTGELTEEERNLVSIAKTIITNMGLPDERTNITVCDIDFLWPTQSTRITSRYGETEDRDHSHEGLDIGAVSPGVAGDKIYAAADGTVIEVAYDDSRGNYVTIDHGDGIMTIYMHMSEFRATVGNAVRQGQVIGYMGTTGNSTGVHLHFGVYIDSETVDPLECEYIYDNYESIEESEDIDSDDSSDDYEDETGNSEEEDSGDEENDSDDTDEDSDENDNATYVPSTPGSSDDPMYDGMYDY